MNELRSKLLSLENPLNNIRHLIIAVWMAAAEIKDGDQADALRGVLDLARDEWGMLRDRWDEAIELAGGRAVDE